MTWGDAPACWLPRVVRAVAAGMLRWAYAHEPRPRFPAKPLADGGVIQRGTERALPAYRITDGVPNVVHRATCRGCGLSSLPMHPTKVMEFARHPLTCHYCGGRTWAIKPETPNHKGAA